MFRQDFSCPALLMSLISLIRTGLSPTMADCSKSFRLKNQRHWPDPRSLATTSGVSVDVLSSGYLDVSVPQVRLSLLRYPCGWVAPFGDTRIKACSQLPMSYRSVPRPSSPLSAKASTECPSFASSLSLSILTAFLAFGQNATDA